MTSDTTTTLTIRRDLIASMPADWRHRFADALAELDDTIEFRHQQQLAANAAAAAGAALLDKRRPGWELRIDIDRMDTLDRRWGVLGQEYHADAQDSTARATAARRYWLSLGAVCGLDVGLLVLDPMPPCTGSWAAEHGFERGSVPGHEVSSTDPALQRAWLAEIERRLLRTV